MKKILSIFLVLVIMMSVLCAVPVSAENDYGICYTKVGNNIIVEAKGLGDKTADLYVASYRGGQLVMAECCEIDSLASNSLVIEEGLDYKFFVWEDNGNLTPVFDELTVNTQTPNGTGTAEKGEFIKVKAEVIKTPKSNPELCVDDSGEYMVELAIIESESEKLSEDTVYVYAGNTDVVNMNGWIVDAFIKEDTSLDAWVLESVSLDGNVETIALTECLGDIKVYSSSVKYYESETATRESEIRLANEINYYYNGVELSESNLQYWFIDLQTLLCEYADKVVFMCSDGRRCDKIFVTDYVNKVVETVDIAKKFIKFDPRGGVYLDKDMRAEPYFAYNIYGNNGNKMQLEGIKQGDVLSIACPITEYFGVGDLDFSTYFDIYVSDEKVTGMVESIYSDGSVMIGGKKYQSHISLLVGSEGIFHISVDGKIEKISTTESQSENYAYYISTDIKTGFSKTEYTLNLITDKGEESLKVADSVVIHNSDGSIMVAQRYDNTIDSFFGTTGNLFGVSLEAPSEGQAKERAGDRLFKYKTDETGKIFEIIMPGDAENHFWSSVEKTNAVYDATEGTFGGKDISSAKLFMAPVVETNNSFWNVDSYKVKTADFSSLDENDSYNSYLYYSNGSDKPSAVVIYDLLPETFEGSPLAVVTAVGTKVDADDNTVTSYTIVQSGENKVLAKDYDIEDVDDAVLSVGDVFQYAVNDDGEICMIEIVYDASERSLSNYVKYGCTVSDDAVGFAFGVISEFSDSIVLSSAVDENLDPVMYTELDISKTEKSTYALYDEEVIRYAVKSITAEKIKEKVNTDSICAAIVKVNRRKQAEDIIVIALDSVYFNDAADINDFANWKLTY